LACIEVGLACIEVGLALRANLAEPSRFGAAPSRVGLALRANLACLLLSYVSTQC
jgi:hypothetical protein